MKNQEVKETWVSAKYIRTDGMVLDFTGLYEVSSLGRVRSLNYLHTRKVKVMSPATCRYKDSAIWYHVGLRKDNKKYILRVHRLVLSSFNPEGWFPGADIDHVVERTKDSCVNSISNLVWCTRSYNNSKEHRKEVLSNILTNRKDLSKHVKVIFPDGTSRVFPSAKEADRVLGLPLRTVSRYICKHKGFYKKLNLHFEYIE